MTDLYTSFYKMKYTLFFNRKMTVPVFCLIILNSHKSSYCEFMKFSDPPVEYNDRNNKTLYICSNEIDNMLIIPGTNVYMYHPKSGKQTYVDIYKNKTKEAFIEALLNPIELNPSLYKTKDVSNENPVIFDGIPNIIIKNDGFKTSYKFMCYLPNE